MLVHSEQIDQGKHAQHKQEDISEDHLSLWVHNDEENSGLNENEYWADVRCKHIVLEVDTHVFDALSMPLKFTKLNDVLVVHFGWENNILCIPEAVEKSD